MVCLCDVQAFGLFGAMGRNCFVENKLFQQYPLNMFTPGMNTIH